MRRSRSHGAKVSVTVRFLTSVLLNSDSSILEDTIMKILRVIQLTLLAHHLCGTETFAFPPDIFDDRHLYTFDECEETLDLSGKGLTKFDRNFISDGTCLENLSLRNNNIQEFQEGIFSDLTDLEYLDLSWNKLSPTTMFSFGSVPSLKTLILEENKRKNIFHDILFSFDTKFHFPELTRLSLVATGITHIEINWSEYFPKIEELDVSENYLVSVDDFLKNLPPTLRSLKMRVMGLTKLRIQNLNNLRSLKLDGNNFHSIKRSNCDEDSLCLENLDGLEYLSAFLCDIHSITPDAFEHMTKLAHLDIGVNKITQISKGTFGYSPSLSYLDINVNPLVDISFLGELKNLTTLHMNGIEDSQAMKSLWSLSSLRMVQDLSLGANEISSIPRRFLDNLQDLRELRLFDNRISFLSPGSWQKNLKVIDLSNNLITKIEDLHLSEATSLELLDLRGNELLTIEPQVKKTLPENVDLKL
ncbi:hypothetical protein QAD02_004400 [Eretmocerus hayati]|uniref:Uncharacterized protein n=1 Tax=Eretmocerus hayati TaxID=131215 RepID=A0ACC2NQJ3_9HYME|nr:hypothetical protein QAD02_004400 [Eretmocerus hayati]